MKQKILALLGKAKALALKSEKAAPLAVGIAIGYICKPEIKIFLGLVVALCKFCLKLL